MRRLRVSLCATAAASSYASGYTASQKGSSQWRHKSLACVKSNKHLAPSATVVWRRVVRSTKPPPPPPSTSRVFKSQSCYGRWRVCVAAINTGLVGCVCEPTRGAVASDDRVDARGGIVACGEHTEAARSERRLNMELKSIVCARVVTSRTNDVETNACCPSYTYSDDDHARISYSTQISISSLNHTRWYVRT